MRNSSPFSHTPSLLPPMTQRIKWIQQLRFIKSFCPKWKYRNSFIFTFLLFLSPNPKLGKKEKIDSKACLCGNSTSTTHSNAIVVCVCVSLYFTDTCTPADRYFQWSQRRIHVRQARVHNARTGM